MAESNATLDSTALRRYLDWARTSIWLIPTALCLIALVLAGLFLHLDRICEGCQTGLLSLDLDAVAARQLLGVLVTSVLSVGGVSFSVTMVALTLTSGQYGPKVLRHFLADTRSKVSLGLFFGTAVYSLAVSISLGVGDKPRLSLVVALVLGLLALIEFIGFIHRTAADLQADQLIQRLGSALRQDMRRLRSAEENGSRTQGSLAWRRAARNLERQPIWALEEGYVQTTDYASLAQVLRRNSAVAALRVRPGDFVVKGSELMGLWRGPKSDVATLREELLQCISMGPIRTPIQDPEFPITQIQQIAARALSTGINDPGTAITCIDWLTLALAEIVDSPLPDRQVLDAQGNARLLTRPLDFPQLMRLVYAPLRQFTASDLQVTGCLLDSLNRLASRTRRFDRLTLLREEGLRLWDQVSAEKHADYDTAPIRYRLQQMRRRTDKV
jgi:uncharacterized membrane protein